MIKLLTALSILSYLPVISGNISTYIENNDSNKEKYIYVDISLNETFLEESSNPYFIYKDKEEHNVELISEHKNIYKTKSPISLDIFTIKENIFYLACNNGEYKTDIISGNNPLSESIYNSIILSNDTSIKGYGNYGNTIDNPGATYKTQRVWLSDSHSPILEEKGYWKEKEIPYVVYEYNNTVGVIKMLSILSSYDDVTYYYADIPYQISSLSFVIGSNEDIHPIFYKEYEISSLLYGVIYSLNLLNDDSVGVKTTVCNGASATMLGLVVEAYLTYGNSSSNGAIKSTLVNVFNTWFDKKSASKEDLKNTKINDYTGYAANGNSYEGLEKNGSFSINEKWNTMCSQAGIDPNTGKVRSTNWFSVNGTTIKIILLISAGALVSAGGLVVHTLIKKKKEKQ